MLPVLGAKEQTFGTNAGSWDLGAMNMEEKEKGGEVTRDAYSDFLRDISDQAAEKQEQKDFSVGMARDSDEFGDIAVHAGARVRAVREKRGLSLTDISQRTGIVEPTLEEIETGRMDPPLGMVIKLAKALEMKMGYFISGEETRPFTIIRHDDRKVISRYDSKKGRRYGYTYESLAAYKKDRHMEPFLVTLEPADTEEERSTHDGQEFIYVLEGTMEVRLGKKVHLINAGDAIYYDSTVPHLVKCHGEKPTKILAVLYAER